jgi:hypothetical protein
MLLYFYTLAVRKSFRPPPPHSFQYNLESTRDLASICSGTVALDSHTTDVEAVRSRLLIDVTTRVSDPHQPVASWTTEVVS